MKERVYKIVQLVWIALVVCFVFLYLKNNLENLRNYEFTSQPLWLVLALICELIRRMAGGVRWFLVSTPNQDTVSRVEFLEHLHTFFVSNLAMYIPGTVWQVMSRIHLGHQKGHSALKVSMGIVYEIAFMVCSGTMIGSYMIVEVFDLSLVQCVLLVFALGFMATVLVHPAAVNTGLRLVLTVLRRPVVKVETTVKRGSVLLFVSLGAWIFGGASLYCISRAIMPDLAGEFLPYVISLYAMGWVIGFLTPWAPAGLGIRDGIFVWGLNAYMTAPFPVLVAIASRLISIIPDLFWAAVSHATLKCLKDRRRGLSQP